MGKKSFVVRERGLVPEDAEELIIPDEAIHYVVSNFLQEKMAVTRSPVVTGVTSADVEHVLQLFVDWAARNGYIKSGILTIGGYKIDN